MKPRKVNKIVEEVTKNIIKRSKLNRLKYLQKLNAAKDLNIRRDLLSCGNIAHSVAGCSSSEKKEIISGEKPNIAIVSAYNDMLSAHKPYENYPSLIKNVIQKTTVHVSLLAVSLQCVMALHKGKLEWNYHYSQEM